MLNITLFIQIFNFLITYWFLARFFFKPILKFVQNEEQKKLLLDKSIINYHAAIQDHGLQRQQIRQSASYDFHKYVDFCTQIYIKPKAIDHGLKECELQSEQNKQIIDNLAQVQEKKIVAME